MDIKTMSDDERIEYAQDVKIAQKHIDWNAILRAKCRPAVSTNQNRLIQRVCKIANETYDSHLEVRLLTKMGHSHSFHHNDQCSTTLQIKNTLATVLSKEQTSCSKSKALLKTKNKTKNMFTFTNNTTLRFCLRLPKRTQRCHGKQKYKTVQPSLMKASVIIIE